MSQVHTRSLDAVPPPAAFVQVTFLLGFLSTVVHYWHNFVYAADYPPVFLFPSELAYQVGIAVFWPTLTLWGAWGVVLYTRGRCAAALAPLASWTLLGVTSPGHFLGGVPDVPAYAMFTISTDFGTGVVMLVLVGLTWLAVRSGRASNTAGA